MLYTTRWRQPHHETIATRDDSRYPSNTAVDQHSPAYNSKHKHTYNTPRLTSYTKSTTNTVCNINTRLQVTVMLTITGDCDVDDDRWLWCWQLQVTVMLTMTGDCDVDDDRWLLMLTTTGDCDVDDDRWLWCWRRQVTVMLTITGDCDVDDDRWLWCWRWQVTVMLTMTENPECNDTLGSRSCTHQQITGKLNDSDNDRGWQW